MDLTNSVNIIQQIISRNSGYKARIEIDSILSSYSNFPHRLEVYGFKVYSQSDEDGILNEIFKRIGVSKGTFFEIGVDNGLECNSLFLLHSGWSGTWLEANSNHKNFFLEKFDCFVEKNKLSIIIDYANPENINHYIQSTLNINSVDDESSLDFLSIDIDGMDYYLFQELTHKPKVLCIEYNSKFPPPLCMYPVYNSQNVWKGHSSDYMGSSLESLKRLGDIKGYKLIATNITGVNAFFIRDDLSHHFITNLNTIDYYNPPRYYLWADHYSSQVGHLPDCGHYHYD